MLRQRNGCRTSTRLCERAAGKERAPFAGHSASQSSVRRAVRSVSLTAIFAVLRIFRQTWAPIEFNAEVTRWLLLHNCRLMNPN